MKNPAESKPREIGRREIGRREIDKIDAGIVELLDKRARLALELQKEKNPSSEAVYSASREAQILANVEEAHGGPFPKSSLRSVFGEIVSGCRHLQSEERIVLLGEKFGWVHDAALAQFGSSSNFAPVEAGEEVIEAIKKDPSALAFFHLGGAANEIHLLLEAMLAGELPIVAEIQYRHRYSLVCGQRVEIPEITDIFATRETLSALRKWVLSLSFPVKINICRSVEEVIENLVDSKPLAGLIPQGIANTRELNLVQGNIEPAVNHACRCVTVSGRAGGTLKKGMKTSVLCALPDKPGSLAAAISPHEKYGCNLMRVEMFPFHGKPWNDLFLIDFASPDSEKKLASLLQEMEERCRLLKCLGTYPVMK